MSDAFYGRWAGLYDRISALPFMQSWRRRAVGSLALASGDTVVEMGCGTGTNVPALREGVGPDGRVVGLDLTGEMLRRARTHPGRVGARVDYFRGDATRPPVRDVDAVLATFVAGVFPDPAAAVDAWCDCLKPGGRIALLNFQQPGGVWAAALSPVFEAFVRLSAPGSRLDSESRADAFGRRVAAARRRLTARTADRRYQRFAGGYLGLVSGRVE